MNYIWIFLSLLLFASCRSNRGLESNAVPTTFQGDSLFFDGIDQDDIAYSRLFGILTSSEVIKPHKKVSVAITQPTIFRIFQTYYIVYPGDDVIITADKNGVPLFRTKDNKQRNQEFLFQSAFQNFDQKLWPQFPMRTTSYPIDTILGFENKVKEAIPTYISKVNVLYDSLATAYQISDDFKKLYKTVVENKYNRILSSLYSTYAAELKEEGLYLQKQKTLLPYLNNIKDKEKLHLEATIEVESVAQAILTTKIRRIKDETEMRGVMDTVINNFTGLSRDFLLTKIMYTAIHNRVSLSKGTIRFYSRRCKDATYRSIVKNLLVQKKKYAVQAKWKKDNRLIALSDDKVYTVDEVIKQQKGRLVLIDMWASWCVPCLEQHPYLEKLKQQFDDEKISFLFLSLDKRMYEWKQGVEKLGLDPSYSYVFENPDNSSFLKKFGVETIPRFILVDQNGNVIAAEAPFPNDVELEKLIKTHLK